VKEMPCHIPLSDEPLVSVKIEFSQEFLRHQLLVVLFLHFFRRHILCRLNDVAKMDIGVIRWDQSVVGQT
jgi:hypothetical protein